MGQKAAADRKILFLQGPPSGFWWQLARAFQRRGFEARRIAFCAGDLFYWPPMYTSFFLGKRAVWHGYLRNYVKKNSITDIIYYADRNPYHRVARHVAMELGIHCYVVEFGYLRPGWLTLERGGMSAYSHFPNNPEHILEISRSLKTLSVAETFSHHWLHEIVNEITFSVTNLIYSPIFRNYDPEYFYNPLFEYVSGARQRVRRLFGEKHHRQVAADCMSGRWPFALYALQLQSDWQIRANSGITDQRDALRLVAASFAAHAPSDMRLVVKIHPLDPGIIDWAAELRERAHEHGLDDRLVLFDGGDLDALLAVARGVIVINSTVGLHALRKGVPVKVLGVAIYDIPGLTHQGALDDFWHAASPVDRRVFCTLKRLMQHSIQIAGSFYNRRGRRAAAKAIVERITSNTVNEPGAYVSTPPRLERARQLNILVDDPAPR